MSAGSSNGGPPHGPSDETVDRLLRALPAAEHVDDGLLLAWRSGALSEPAAAQIAAHVASCGACRRLADELPETPSDALLDRAESAVRVPQPRFGGLRTGVAAVVLAAAAAVVLVLALPGEVVQPPPDYVVSGPHGAVKTTRGEAEQVGRPTFLPTSRLRLGLAPAVDLEGPAPPVAVFVSRPGRPLRPTPAEDLVRGEGGALRFEADAGELFGGEYGTWQVHIVVARDAERLRDLAGRRAEETRDEPDLRWKTIDLNYRPRAD